MSGLIFRTHFCVKPLHSSDTKAKRKRIVRFFENNSHSEYREMQRKPNHKSSQRENKSNSIRIDRQRRITLAECESKN